MYLCCMCKLKSVDIYVEKEVNMSWYTFNLAMILAHLVSIQCNIKCNILAPNTIIMLTTFKYLLQSEPIRAPGDEPGKSNKMNHGCIVIIKCSLFHKALDGVGGCHVTGELVFPATAAGLGTALVLVIAVSIVIVIKLQKDKINMVKLIKSMTVQTSSGIALKRDVMKTFKSVIRGQLYM